MHACMIVDIATTDRPPIAHACYQLRLPGAPRTPSLIIFFSARTTKFVDRLAAGLLLRIGRQGAELSKLEVAKLVAIVAELVEIGCAGMCARGNSEASKLIEL